MSWKLKVPQPFVFVLFSFSTCVCFKFQKLSTRIVVLKICAHTNTLVVFFFKFHFPFFKMSPRAGSSNFVLFHCE